MASQKGKLIYPQRYKILKAAVKAECLRRNKVGSVASYGGVQYDYTHEPDSDSIIATEHFSKNNIPLRAINPDGMPSTLEDRIITDDDMLILETKVATFADRDIYDQSPTDCASSCTGTCTTSCSGSCTDGCSGDCWARCQSSCSNGCGNGCGGQCSTTCGGECDAGCVGFCYSSCYGTCEGACYVGCDTDCGDRCSAGCLSECSHCGTSCSDACGVACQYFAVS